MYVLLIRLLHTTTAENSSSEEKHKIPSISSLEEALIQFILIQDRSSFFEVMKFWVHYEHNENILDSCQKFEVLFPFILTKILNSRLFMISNEWISFIQTLPVYPKLVFKHIYQVGLNSIHKDVAAIKLCSKMVLSKCYKISIKKE